MKEKGNVYIADSNNGFFGIKEYIRKCQIVISARMHCAINAIEENVPTIFLSYSQKSIGMCQYIYGDTKWCISLEEIESKLMERINEMINHHKEVCNTLCARNKEIMLEYKLNIDKIKRIL